MDFQDIYIIRISLKLALGHEIRKKTERINFSLSVLSPTSDMNKEIGLKHAFIIGNWTF